MISEEKRNAAGCIVARMLLHGFIDEVKDYHFERMLELDIDVLLRLNETTVTGGTDVIESIYLIMFR